MVENLVLSVAKTNKKTMTKLKVKIEYEIEVDEHGKIPSMEDMSDGLKWQVCGTIALGYGLSPIWRINQDTVKVKVKKKWF
jgi:hypothetical protein